MKITEYIIYLFYAIGGIGGIFAITIGIIYIYKFAEVCLLEKEINKLYSERDKKISKIRESTGLTSFIEGKSKQESRDYNEKIEPLERKRRFILDKLPFLRK